MSSNQENKPAKNPNLTLVPARPAGEQTESYLATDGIWFQKVRHLASLWEEGDFGEDGPDEVS